MRNLLMWIAVAMSWVTAVRGQDLSSQQLSVEIKAEKLDEQRAALERYQFQQNYYLSIQLQEIPDQRQRQQLKAKGIELLSFSKHATYLAKVPKHLTGKELEALGVRAIKATPITTKISQHIQTGNIPESAIAQPGWIDIAVGIVGTHHSDKLERLIANLGGTMLKEVFNHGNILTARIPQNQLTALAASPLIAFIDALQAPDQPLNHEVRNVQRVNQLNKGFNGIPGLNGAGVVIGIGDGGKLGDHIDFDNRVINKANGTYSSFGSHGDHVAGIVGGAGHINPRHRGIAAEATLITQKTSLITYYAEEYYNDHGMVLTNNSYGTSFNCATNGSYNYSSLTLDQQLRELPNLLHVFAAGNSGGNTCPDYPRGYRTVLRYYQAAKNVLTVGNVNKDRSIRSNSSRGPVADGRIKPEIVAVGSNVVSTGRDFNYFSSSGTSMASPATAATLALLYERYRQLNNGADPTGALIKAIACNTAEDLGNPGPDYTYGFGLINGRRAVEVINKQQYTADSINQGGRHTHNITIPAGVKRVKAMLYWHDKEAEAFAEKALINDLDITLVAPGGQTYLPWGLDPDPNQVDASAIRKIDTLNNIEQITLDNPTAGTYQIFVDGSSVPFGAQSYVIVYEFIEEELELTYPTGGETLTPGVQEYIQWDADATNYEEFTLEYSEDGGQTWEILEDGIDPDARHYTWTVPSGMTAEATLRLRKGGSGGNTTEHQVAFNIVDAPSALEATPYCDGMVGLNWNAVSGTGISYEVSIFDGTHMTLLATVSDTSYIVDEDLTIGEQYWFSVNAIVGSSVRSTRAIATYCVPDPNELCPWLNDPELIQVAFNDRGRFNTVNSLRPDEDVKIKLRNVGTNTLDSVRVCYQVNDRSVVSEWVRTPIESGDTLIYAFQQKADLSEVGTYRINTWIYLPNDPNPGNDSIMNGVTATQLPNEEVQLPFGDDFITAEDKTYTSSTIGIDGTTSLDFNLAGNGQLIVQDTVFYLQPADETDTSNIANDLILTLDLREYIDRIPMMVMHFKHYSMETGVGPLSLAKRDPASVWIRGNDTEEWILAVELDNYDTWKSERNIQIRDILEEAGQSLSASTQIRFRQSDSFGLALRDVVVEEIHVLPVEWIDFQAAADENGTVTLSWTTLNEENNDYFEILAASMQEGEEGLPVYKPIARVDSRAVADNTEQSYRFIDQEFFAGEVFYKIRQVDYDDSSSESPVRVVRINNITPGEINIYPNPFDGHINIATSPAFGDVYAIRLLNVQGQTLAHLENTTNNRNLKLSFPGIPAGYYLLELQGENGVIRKKIVKQ